MFQDIQEVPSHGFARWPGVPQTPDGVLELHTTQRDIDNDSQAKTQVHRRAL